MKNMLSSSSNDRVELVLDLTLSFNFLKNETYDVELPEFSLK
jgi:hypothetical protein